MLQSIGWQRVRQNFTIEQQHPYTSGSTKGIWNINNIIVYGTPISVLQLVQTLFCSPECFIVIELTILLQETIHRPQHQNLLYKACKTVSATSPIQA